MKLSGPGCLFFEITRKRLNSQIRCIVLRVLQTSKEFCFFFSSIILADLLGNVCLLVIGAF